MNQHVAHAIGRFWSDQQALGVRSAKALNTEVKAQKRMHIGPIKSIFSFGNTPLPLSAPSKPAGDPWSPACFRFWIPLRVGLDGTDLLESLPVRSGPYLARIIVAFAGHTRFKFECSAGSIMVTRGLVTRTFFGIARVTYLGRLQRHLDPGWRFGFSYRVD